MSSETDKEKGEAVPIATIIQDETHPPLSLCDVCKECISGCYKNIEFAHGAAWQMGFDDDVVTLGGAKHHKSRQQWEDAIQKNCYVCCRLEEILPPSLLSDPSDPAAVESGEFLECNTSYQRSRPPLIHISRLGHGIKLSMLLATPGRLKTEIYNLGPSTGSGPVWERAHKWIQDCTQNHERCREGSANESWYPTRLIDIGTGSTEPGKIETIKLIETSRTQVHGPYVTLSHCWGGGAPVMLKKDNLANFLQRIPDLPRTFQETVQAARKLQVQYMWIDSLCIIQDQTEDWAKEAQLMHKVYRHAWCNISATASWSSDQGLFRTRKRDHFVGPLVVDCGGDRNAVLVEEDLFTKAVELSPLQTRAWVLQERLLSMRILHFAGNQVFWECNTEVASETFPEFLFRGISYHSMRNIVWSEETPLQNWAPVVRNYTLRSLTYISDKLPAISGIAEILGGRWGGFYHCGIWNNDDILPQLAWRVDSGPNIRPSPPRAPTWSWISVDSPVSLPEWSEKGYHPIAKIVHCETTIDDHDPRKPVRGLLIAEGPMQKYAPLRPPEDYASEREQRVIQKNKVVLDIEPCSMDNLYLLPLYKESYMDYDADRHGASSSRFYYMLLMPDDSDSSTLRRCGLVVTHSRGGFRRLLTDPKDFSETQDREARLPVGEYLDSARGYRVRIV